MVGVFGAEKAVCFGSLEWDRKLEIFRQFRIAHVSVGDCLWVVLFMSCDALDSTNELSDFLLGHVSRFWYYCLERITCCCVLIFVNICMLDILTCVVWK